MSLAVPKFRINLNSQILLCCAYQASSTSLWGDLDFQFRQSKNPEMNLTKFKRTWFGVQALFSYNENASSTTDPHNQRIKKQGVLSGQDLLETWYVTHQWVLCFVEQQKWLEFIQVWMHFLYMSRARMKSVDIWAGLEWKHFKTSSAQHRYIWMMGRTHHSNCRSCEKTVDIVKALQPLHSDHLPSAIPLFAKAKQSISQAKAKAKKSNTKQHRS